MESMYEKNKLVEEYIENKVREVNAKYHDMISDSHMEILKEEFLDSSDNIDDIIKAIDEKIDELIKEYMKILDDIDRSGSGENVSEEMKERIAKDVSKSFFKNNFGIETFVNDVYDDVFNIKDNTVDYGNVDLDSNQYSVGTYRRNINVGSNYLENFYGQSYNYQLIELFKILDMIDAYGDGLEIDFIEQMFNEKKEELLASFPFVANGIEELDYQTTRNLYNNFNNDVDMIVDEGTSKMNYIIRDDVDLFLDDGNINIEAFNFDEAAILYDYARDNGKSIKLHTLLWHNSFPSSLQKELDGKDPEIKKEITMKFLDQYMNVLSRWSTENGYDFSQIDVVNEIVNDDYSDWIFRDSVWTDAVGIDRLSINSSTVDIEKHDQACGDFYSEVFMMARGHFSSSELLINEYNEFLPHKCDKICNAIEMIQNNGRSKLNENSVIIDGLGMQSHYYDYYIDEVGNKSIVMSDYIVDSTEKFANLGIDLHRTEKDFTYYDINNKERILNTIDMVDEKYNVRSCIAWNNNDLTSWKKGHINSDIHMVDRYGVGKEEYNRVVDKYSNCRRKQKEELKILENKNENEMKKDKPKMLIKQSDNAQSNSGFTSTVALVVISLVLFGIFLMICI